MIDIDELLYKVVIDKPFYRSTGGGITLSGGEATMQMTFLNSFLKELKKEGIHVALETCGFFNIDSFRDRILPHLDLIYFDLKLINDEKSRFYTGQSSRPVLENFLYLIREANVPVFPRIPLIPEVTATKENLSDISRFLKDQNVEVCSLIPYNPLWQDKLVALGLASKYKGSSYMTGEEEQTCVGYFSQP